MTDHAGLSSALERSTGLVFSPSDAAASIESDPRAFSVATGVMRLRVGLEPLVDPDECAAAILTWASQGTPSRRVAWLRELPFKIASGIASVETPAEWTRLAWFLEGLSRFWVITPAGPSPKAEQTALCLLRFLILTAPLRSPGLDWDLEPDRVFDSKAVLEAEIDRLFADAARMLSAGDVDGRFRDVAMIGRFLIWADGANEPRRLTRGHVPGALPLSDRRAEAEVVLDFDVFLRRYDLPASLRLAFTRSRWLGASALLIPVVGLLTWFRPLAAAMAVAFTIGLGVAAGTALRSRGDWLTPLNLRIAASCAVGMVASLPFLEFIEPSSSQTLYLVAGGLVAGMGYLMLDVATADARRNLARFLTTAAFQLSYASLAGWFAVVIARPVLLGTVEAVPQHEELITRLVVSSLAVGAGTLLQLLWEDKALTYPLVGRARR